MRSTHRLSVLVFCKKCNEYVFIMFTSTVYTLNMSVFDFFETTVSSKTHVERNSYYTRYIHDWISPIRLL